MSIRVHYSSAFRLSPPPKATASIEIGHEEEVVRRNGGDHNSSPMTRANHSAHYDPIGARIRWKHFRQFLRVVLFDVPLLLLFASFVGIWLLREIYSEYFVPLIDRATRTDAQLLEEFTYYERQCTEYDISTRDLSDMLLSTAEDDPIPTAVQQMLRHGTLVIPNLLSLPTVQSLRHYIVDKNANIPVEEHYPVSQGHRRLSYGIDAAEHPAVATAIAQVLQHPVLVPLLSALLGDPDPASAEITAIMNYYGASAQVWHQDTKQDGNAIKFARTYSHSYSLFIPLQDVTPGMGATDICPGTHYCANDLVDLCERTQLSLHQVEQQNQTFPAGYGALLNQHVWHRGGAHVDPDAPERILFILSFLARPDVHPDDFRQLSRGTYFHQKWNMWGHTVQDLRDPLRAMRPPWSVLRALSLWKAPSAHWGYDLITASVLRLANEQLEISEWTDRLRPRLRNVLGWWERFPTEPIDYESAASHKELWMRVLHYTLDRLYQLVRHYTLYAQAIYWLLLLVVTSVVVMFRGAPEGWRRLRRTTRRMLLWHTALVLLGIEVWQSVRHSEWGRSVRSGRALQRPFPPAPTSNCATTTVPTRSDVLGGTRYDADFLGSYNAWLDHHPGNVIYQEAIQSFLGSKASIDDHTMQWQIDHVRRVVQEKTQGGRFLRQDWRTGDWCLLTQRDEIDNTIGSDLRAAQFGGALRTWLNRRIAVHRFGPERATALAQQSHQWLAQLRQRLWGWHREGRPRRDSIKTTPKPPLRVSSMISAMPSAKIPRVPAADDLAVGSLIWFHFDNAEAEEEEDAAEYWIPGVVLKVHRRTHQQPPRYDITLDDGAYYQQVPWEQLEEYHSVQTGDRVQGCFERGLVDCYPGTVEHVYPGADVRILYDDGEVYDHVPATMYYVPPYYYEGPLPAA
jgi:Phytanoyl-CoA dioxygenase (PhyH)